MDDHSYSEQNDPNLDLRRRLDLRTITTFLEVAREQSIIKVAERSNTPPSTISARLKKLEAILNLNNKEGERLFKRFGATDDATLLLTKFGAAVFNDFLRIEEDLEQAFQSVDKIRHQNDPIRIGIQGGAYGALCKRIINILDPANNSVLASSSTIVFYAERSHVLMEKLEREELDLVVAQCVNHLKESMSPRFDFQRVYKEKLILVTSDKSCRNLLDIVNLDGRHGVGSRFISVDWGGYYAQHQKSVFQRFPTLRIDFEFKRAGAALDLVLDTSDPDSRINHYCAGFFPVRMISTYLNSDHEGPRLWRVGETGYPHTREMYVISKISAERKSDHYLSYDRTRASRLDKTRRAIIRACDELNDEMVSHDY